MSVTYGILHQAHQWPIHWDCGEGRASTRAHCSPWKVPCWYATMAQIYSRVGAWCCFPNGLKNIEGISKWNGFLTLWSRQTGNRKCQLACELVVCVLRMIRDDLGNWKSHAIVYVDIFIKDGVRDGYWRVWWGNHARGCWILYTVVLKTIT